MTLFVASWLWTFFRSMLLIALALPMCGLLARWIDASKGWRRIVQWGLLGVPFLFPELLTGYAYGQMTRLLITGPWLRELWFDLLLFLRVVPVGMVLWYCAPASPLSREAIHARWLAFRPADSTPLRLGVLSWYWLQGPARSAVFAGCGLFLVVFQEFELASLLAVTSWTVWLFDAQVEGLPAWAALRYVAIPAVLTWIACARLPAMFLGPRRQSAGLSSQPRFLSTTTQAVLWAYLGLACGLSAVCPLALIGLEVPQGLTSLISNPEQFRNLWVGILISSGTALLATMVADATAEVILLPFRGRGWRRAVWWIASVGLSGQLAVGLIVHWLFQHRLFRSARNAAWPFVSDVWEWLPVLCGLLIWLLPRAVILQSIRRAFCSPITEHSVVLLANASDAKRQAAAHYLHWLVIGRGRFATRALLFHWAYWDLTLPHLLNPTGFTSSPVRLYIDAHFARNAVLTAKAGFTMLAPIVLLMIVWGFIRINQTLRGTRF